MSLETKSRGVVYCSTRRCHGRGYYSGRPTSYSLYANRSAGSIKSFFPNIETTLFTDCKPPKHLANIDNIILFSDLSLKPGWNDFPFGGKIESIKFAPYKQSLFLDADTMVLRDEIVTVFDLLKRFDVVGAYDRDHHRSGAYLPNVIDDKYIDVPLSFPEFNTGVIAFKKNPTTQQAFCAWRELYREDFLNKTAMNDQQGFRAAMWRSSVNLGVLPVRYNYKVRKPTLNHSENCCNTVVHHNRHAYPELSIEP